MLITSLGKHHSSKNYNPLNVPQNFVELVKSTIFFSNDKQFCAYKPFISKSVHKPITPDSDILYQINEEIFNKQQLQVDLVSDQIKIFIPRCHIGFGHYILDTIGLILESVNKVKDPMFVIDINNLINFEWSSRDKHNAFMYVSFLKNYLDSINAKYVLLKNIYSVAINNFYFVEWFEHSDQLYENVYNSFSKPNNKKAIVPNKKIYIKSKRYLEEKNNINLTDLSVDDILNQRIINEQHLENFLIEKGFESMSPGYLFDSLEKQINFFYDVKTIFSVTSSGLINMLFMQPQGNVIELMSPLGKEPYNDTFRLHSGQYQDMAYAKYHNYFAQKNLMDGKLIVDSIQNNEKFLEMLK